MSKIVTGIGSRDIPEPFNTWLRDVATYLKSKGCILRSGGAKGSDRIFQDVFENSNADMEIYIAWNGFEGLYANGKNIILADHPNCKEYTLKYHPNPSYLSVGAFKLMNRNAHQVLGYDLKTPTDIVVCYTQGGKIKGGTSQAIRMAMDYNIPIVNIGGEKSYEDIIEKIDDILGF